MFKNAHYKISDYLLHYRILTGKKTVAYMRIARIMRFYEKILTRRALKGNISVTHVCNMRCLSCKIWEYYIENPELKKHELAVRDYEALFRNFDFGWISFTGGEPFLRKDLVEIVEVAVSNCKSLHTISIPTNGYVTDVITRAVERILELDIPSFYVSVSIDGCEEVHDAQRGVRGSFRRAMRTFKALRNIRNSGLKVHVEYTISSCNQGQLLEFMNKCSLVPNDLVLSIAQNSFFYKNEGLPVRPQKSILFTDARSFLKSYKTRELHDLVQRLFLNNVIKQRLFPCVAGKNSFHIDPYGNIFPCILVKERLGSFRETTLSRFNPGKRSYDPCQQCYTPCENYFGILLSLTNINAAVRLLGTLL